MHLPEQITLMRWRRPRRISVFTSSGSASCSGSPTPSISVCGAAPVPPSEPSTMMKSGALSMPRWSTSSHSCSIQSMPPNTALKPVGLPVSSRIWVIASISCGTLAMSRWRFGLCESSPTGMPRIAAISSVTLAPGSRPPMPGSAPWPSLMLTIFTCLCAQIAVSLSSSSLPSGVRTPYLAVPISNTMSQPPSRWYGASPPSPVSIQMPALAAPIDSARTAGADSAPKLIAEMLKNAAWSYGSRAYGPIRTGFGSTW
ncbi:hypothetical protein RLIN73S_01712 [Rhodanobacter lindaniclasticus]